MNVFKLEIDQLSQQAEGKRAAAAAAPVLAAERSGDGGAGTVLDSEQYELTQQLKAAKVR